MLIKYILKLVKMVNFVLGIFCHSIKGGMVLGWFRCRQRTAGTNVLWEERAWMRGRTAVTNVLWEERAWMRGKPAGLVCQDLEDVLWPEMRPGSQAEKRP